MQRVQAINNAIAERNAVRVSSEQPPNANAVIDAAVGPQPAAQVQDSLGNVDDN